MPLSFAMLPKLLQSTGNYKTHMLGKWHLGFFTQAHTPVGRGYCMIPLSLQPLADMAVAVHGLVPAYI
eukprot:COSAG01_NODE_61052_length_291_cov_1.062500_1_plen_67_part_10